MTTQEPLFYPLIPGQKIPGDWYPGVIPLNIRVGENSVLESSFSFKQEEREQIINKK